MSATYEYMRSTETDAGWRRTSGRSAFHHSVIWGVVANVTDVILDKMQLPTHQ